MSEAQPNTDEPDDGGEGVQKPREIVLNPVDARLDPVTDGDVETIPEFLVHFRLPRAIESLQNGGLGDAAEVLALGVDHGQREAGARGAPDHLVEPQIMGNGLDVIDDSS